jgi:ParB-like chromosome segregation protein Spo0J
MGDLTTLADSIRQEGLLQPIGVTAGLELVFGERRLLAYRDILKHKTILARVVDVTSILAGEYHENEVRKEFTPSERVAIARCPVRPGQLRRPPHGAELQQPEALQAGRAVFDHPMTRPAGKALGRRKG